MNPASLSSGLVEIEVKTPGALSNLVILFLISLPFLFLATLFGILIKIRTSVSSSIQAKKIAGTTIQILVSIIIVFLSLYLPKTFDDPNKLLNVACGFPSTFLTFNSSRSLPDHAWTESCIGWLGEPGGAAQLQFLWLPFFLNVAIVFSILIMLKIAIQLFLKKIRQK